MVLNIVYNEILYVRLKQGYNLTCSMTNYARYPWVLSQWPTTMPIGKSGSDHDRVGLGFSIYELVFGGLGVVNLGY